MRVYVQWTRANPQDWESLDITKDGDWRKLAKKPEPLEGMAGTMQADLGGAFGIKTVLDPSHITADDPGWWYEFECQGVRFGGFDHLHLKTGTGLVVTAWNDDPLDHAGDFRAVEYTFRLPRSDMTNGGALVPNIQVRGWAESQATLDRYANNREGGGDIVYPWIVADWAAFSAPGPANMVMHGIWMEPALVAAHDAAITMRGFRHFLAQT